MKPILALVLAALAMLATCTDTTRYPISGDQCGPADPVQTLSAESCAPAI